MDNNFKKALSLSQKTGDRLIIYDSTGKNDPFVVLPIDEYEQMIGFDEPVVHLTEEQLIDKINRDIANWKARKDESRFEALRPSEFGRDYRNFNDDFENDDSLVDDLEEDDDYSEQTKDYPSQNDDSGFYRLKDMEKPGNKAKSHWRIPTERKEAAEEVIEEDRHYLEDVPF